MWLKNWGKVCSNKFMDAFFIICIIGRQWLLKIWLYCRTPRWLLKTWLCFRALRSAPVCGFRLEVLGYLIYKILWLLFCCLPIKNLNIQEGNTHDREDRITDFATGSFLGWDGHIHQFYWFLNFMYFYLKKFCYSNIKCLLPLVQTGSYFHILSLQSLVLNVTKYYVNENVTIVFI